MVQLLVLHSIGFGLPHPPTSHRAFSSSPWFYLPFTFRALRRPSTPFHGADSHVYIDGFPPNFLTFFFLPRGALAWLPLNFSNTTASNHFQPLSTAYYNSNYSAPTAHYNSNYSAPTAPYNSDYSAPTTQLQLLNSNYSTPTAHNFSNQLSTHFSTLTSHTTPSTYHHPLQTTTMCFGSKAKREETPEPSDRNCDHVGCPNNRRVWGASFESETRRRFPSELPSDLSAASIPLGNRPRPGEGCCVVM
jgi:hypothetical protein